MAYDEPDFETTDDAPLPEESGNNRTFLIAVGILGGIILLSIACLVGVYLFSSQSRETQTAEAAAIASRTAEAANDFVQVALTSTAEALAAAATPTLEPTATSVVNVATATEVAPTIDPNATLDPNATAVSATGQEDMIAATATIGAALTEAAAAQLTVVPTTTLLPDTGFMDDVGVPGLMVMALAFVIVILLARRLRATTA